MRNNSEVPSPIALIEPKSPFTYYESTMSLRWHHFYISQNIEEPEKYIEMIHRIKTAGPDETVYIYLNNGGGRLDTAVQLINAMRMSQAKIVTVVEAEAHSASTMLFLCGDEFMIHDNCSMMFHNFSGGMYGKGNEMKLQIDATTKWFEKLAKSIYYPFLSYSEIQNMIDGKDLWMESDEIRKRLKKMVKILNAERKVKLQPKDVIINDETEEEPQPPKKPRKKKETLPLV